MVEWIIYLLESSALLALLYLVYVVFLRKETYFSLNRYFLLSIPALALLFPFLNFEVYSSPWKVIREIGHFRMTYYKMASAWEQQSAQTVDLAPSSFLADINGFVLLAGLLILVYALGLGFQLYKTCMIFRRMRAMTIGQPHEVIHGMRVIELPDLKSPFSFLNTVFIPRGLDRSAELDPILTHEQVHVRQKHTYDLLFVQLMAAIFWFNPIIWQLLNALKTTHEYIADEKVIRKGYSLVAYQTMLLRQVISNHSHGLVHNFNLSFIKKRITMMNHQKSGWAGQIKVLIAVAVVLVFGAAVAQGNAAFNPRDDKSERLYMDGRLVDLDEGVRISTFESKKFKGIFTAKIDDSRKAEVSYEATLVQGGMGRASVQSDKSINLFELLQKAEVGDRIVFEITTPANRKFLNFAITE